MDWVHQQQWLFTWPGMIAWSTGVMLLTRLLLAAIFRPLVRRERVYCLAYACFPLLLVLGFVVVGISGWQFYGFNPNDWKQWLGYYTAFFSPLGIPVVLGTPAVLVFDRVRRPWRGSQSPHTVDETQHGSSNAN